MSDYEYAHEHEKTRRTPVVLSVLVLVSRAQRSPLTIAQPRSPRCARSSPYSCSSSARSAGPFCGMSMGIRHARCPITSTRTSTRRPDARRLCPPCSCSCSCCVATSSRDASHSLVRGRASAEALRCDIAGPQLCQAARRRDERDRRDMLLAMQRCPRSQCRPFCRTSRWYQAAKRDHARIGAERSIGTITITSTSTRRPDARRLRPPCSCSCSCSLVERSAVP